MDPSEAMAVTFGTGQPAAAVRSDRPSIEETVNRGRSLARLAVEELIDEVHRRAAGHQLDRGLRVSLPYYDDRRLTLRRRDFTVIPRGRILFVPAFVVIATEREIERVRQDRQFTDTTRAHLIDLLGMVRCAFEAPGSR
jgi:hypothetical protein